MRQVYLNAKNEYILMLEVTLEQLLVHANGPHKTVTQRADSRQHNQERLLKLYSKLAFVNNKLYN